MAEDLARVEAAWNEENAECESADHENDNHGDPAHHAHLFGDGGHALGTTELALSHKGSCLFSLNDYIEVDVVGGLPCGVDMRFFY